MGLAESWEKWVQLMEQANLADRSEGKVCLDQEQLEGRSASDQGVSQSLSLLKDRKLNQGDDRLMQYLHLYSN